MKVTVKPTPAVDDTNVWLRRIARSLRNLERMVYVAQNGPGHSGELGNAVRCPGPIQHWEREDDLQPVEGTAESSARRDVRALTRLRQP